MTTLVVANAAATNISAHASANKMFFILNLQIIDLGLIFEPAEEGNLRQAIPRNIYWDSIRLFG
jgi:hypothetical protein